MCAHTLTAPSHVHQHAKRVAALEAQAEAIQVAGSESVAEYDRLKAELDRLGAVILAEMLRPERCMHFMRPGRIIRVRVAGVDFGWGVVCAVSLRDKNASKSGGDAQQKQTSSYVVDTLLRVRPPSGPGKAPQPAGEDGSDGELHVIPVALSCVSGLSALMVQLPSDLRPPGARHAVGAALIELKGRFQAGLPRLDPVNDMHIDAPEFVHAVAKVAELEPQLLAHPLFSPNAEAQRYDAGSEAGRAVAAQREKLQHKAALQSEAAELRARMLDSEVARFRKELHCRSHVLRRLGHIDEHGVVLLKGRAACEIDTADELLVTELMFNGVFGSLAPPVIAAVCSCFVPTEPSSVEAAPQSDIKAAVAKLLDAAQHIGEVQHSAGLAINVDEYVDGFKTTLCDPVYKWCCGTSFAELLRNTDLFEGTLIRAVRRLDELLMQLSAAATAVGDLPLRDKFNAAAESMRHGIMFAGSLYL
jgi:ATP-dependent RNA helicase DOB1